MQARLTITSPHGETFEKLIGNTAIIGRGSAVHVRLSGDPQVSRYHAMLRCHNGFQYQIIDLGSRNGTYAGNTRVLTPASLSDEAYLHIGDHEIFLQSVHSNSTEAAMTLDPSAYLEVVLLVIGVKDLDQKMERLSHDQFTQSLGDWLRNMYAYLANCGAKADRFIRGGLVGYWPVGEEFLLERCLAAARSIVEYGAKREWSKEDPFQICCALHTGRVALGMTADSDSDEPLQGGAINAALKLHDAALKQESLIILSQEARELLVDPSEAVEPLGYAEIGGRAFSTQMHAASTKAPQADASS